MLISAYAGYYTTQCKIINISIFVVTDLVYCIWVQLLTVSNCRHGLRVYITSYTIKKLTNTCKEVLFSVFCSNIQKSQTVIIWAQYCFPKPFLYSERATNNICKWFCTAYFYMKSINTFPKWSSRCLNWISLFFLTVPAYAFNTSALLMYMFK